MKKIFKIGLFILGIILTIFFAFNHPQSLIFPLWIFIYLFKGKFSNLLKGGSSKFILAGITLGLIIEVFALLNNLNQPESVKSIVLFHPQTVPDLILGFFYYLVIIITWFFILKKIDFSVKSVFILAGLFGIVLEQNGAILIGLMQGEFLVAFFVFVIHGVYPMLAYYLTKDNFPKDREKPKWWQYVLILLILYLVWMIIIGSIFIILKPLFS